MLGVHHAPISAKRKSAPHRHPWEGVTEMQTCAVPLVPCVVHLVPLLSPNFLFAPIISSLNIPEFPISLIFFSPDFPKFRQIYVYPVIFRFLEILGPAYPNVPCSLVPERYERWIRWSLTHSTPYSIARERCEVEVLGRGAG